MRYQVADAVGIADDDAMHPPLVLEDVGEEPPVRVHRLAADRVERGHHRCDPGRRGGAERLEVDVLEPMFRHVGRVVVPAALGVTVADEVFRGRGDPARLAEIIALVAADHRRSHHGRQAGILSETLDHPAPPRIAADVDHRGECPVHSARRRLCRGKPGGTFDDVGVEAGRHGQRNRGDRALTVDHIQADQQRDAEAGLLDRDPLQCVDRRGAARPEDRPDARTHPPLDLGRIRLEHNLHLRELLVPGHRPQQRFDAAHGA